MSQNLLKRAELDSARRIEIELTWRSIFRVLVGILVVYAAVRLAPIFKVLLLALLLSVGLYPIVGWAERRKWPRWAGYSTAIGVLLILVVGCLAVIGPLLFRQLTALREGLPKLTEQIIAQLPPSSPMHQALRNSMSPGTVADSRLFLQKAVMFIETTLGGLVSVVVVIALSVYLILEGPRTFTWFIQYVPPAHRAKVSETLKEISRLISAYVAGQCLVSALCACYLFLVLTLLGVPMALLLGIIAGICDILPIIGFFIAVFLAMAVAFANSPTTSLMILVLYGAYHLFENFVIIPVVYGRRLKLSKLAVPLAVAAGGLLGGIVGAVAVLPLLAAYPVIERLWLAPKLRPNVLESTEEDAHGRAGWGK